jgi:hypothetical protein
MLRGYEPLLLAAGQKGHRHILIRSLICLEPFRFDGWPFNDTTIGMGQAQGPSLRDQAERFLRAELHQIVIDLRDLNLFSSAQIVSRERAIALGIADAMVPIMTPSAKPAPRPRPKRLTPAVPTAPELTDGLGSEF